MAKGTFGERLKRERELREVTLEEVSKATRISARFLEALEGEDWAKLPGGVFGRGFVRTIARYLGLSEESLLAEYDLARGENAVPAQPKPEDRIPSPPKWIPAVALLVVMLLLAGLAFGGVYAWRKWKAHRLKQQSPATSSQLTSSTLDVAAQQSPAATPTATALALNPSTSAATHVRVTADDAVALDADLPAGENRHFTATRQFEVAATDSSAVLLELNGVMMPPIGTPGSSGKMFLSAKDLKQVTGGASQP
jgi:cytoskeleton protein RodZ